MNSPEISLNPASLGRPENPKSAAPCKWPNADRPLHQLVLAPALFFATCLMALGALATLVDDRASPGPPPAEAESLEPVELPYPFQRVGKPSCQLRLAATTT